MSSTNLAELRANAHLPATEFGSNNLAKFFAANKKQIESVIPKHMTSERMMRIAFNAITTTPQLAECTVESLMGAVIQSSILGVEPNTPLGQAYLVPFFNGKKKVKEVQFIIGYKGLIDLARRSGQIESINSHEVYSNDEFSFEYGLEEKLVHKPSWERDRGNMVGAYAVAKFKDGGHIFEVMSLAHIEEIRDNSQGYRAAKKMGFSSPWMDNFDEMARKTVIRRIAKYLPMSIEMQQAQDMDDVAAKGITQDLETALDGDFVVLNPSDQDIATKNEAELDQNGYFTSASGEKVNAHGEVWNPEIHATGRDNHGPIINSDGTFRAKRGVAKAAIEHDKEPEEVKEESSADQLPNSEAADTPQEKEEVEKEEEVEAEVDEDSAPPPPMDLD